MCLSTTTMTDMEKIELLTELDVGNLSVTKIKDFSSENNRGESWLSSTTLEAVKAIFKEIAKLPKHYNGDTCVVKLPAPTTMLPREKPVPKPKPPTRWESFIQKKGITKKRKEKSIWDQNSKSWKPSYGFKNAKNAQEDWMVELPNNADPNENPFGKKKEIKKENVAKNEYQRLRNIAETSKVKVTNMESLERADKSQLTKSMSAAKVATASMGKFTKSLAKEKPIASRKRKFNENIPRDVKTEKENYLKILKNMNKGKPKLEIKEAVQTQVMKKHRRFFGKQSTSTVTEENMKKSDKPDNRQKKKKPNKNGKKNSSFTRGKKGGKNTFKKK